MSDSKLPPLLRMIAHDLKGLLGTPGLLLHLAETAQSDREREERLASLRESFRALDRAVTDLGDLGHAIGGNSAPNFQATDVRGLVESVVQLAKPAAALRHIELATSLDGAAWPAAHADPTTLSRAFERLVHWGITHSKSGARLEVSGVVQDGHAILRIPVTGGATVVPTVEERLEELGEPGSRELGVALPLARETLERHGGSLTAFADGTLEARVPVVQTPL